MQILCCVQTVVLSLQLHELIMLAQLGYFAMADDGNLLSIVDSGETVGNSDAGTTLLGLV